MKKQINASGQQTRKLSLSKRTIAILRPSQMNGMVGGGHYGSHGCNHTANCSQNCTQNGGNTCPGHNTCYNC